MTRIITVIYFQLQYSRFLPQEWLTSSAGRCSGRVRELRERPGGTTLRWPSSVRFSWLLTEADAAGLIRLLPFVPKLEMKPSELMVEMNSGSKFHSVGLNLPHAEAADGA